MPTINVNIQPEILTWVLDQIQKEKLGEKLLSNVSQWLNGSKAPTFSQIEDLSRRTEIPLGYFFLEKPPVEELKLLEFRTVDSIELTNPSRNLIDTIYEMEQVQDWMKNYRRDLGYEKLSFVGSVKDERDIKTVVERIRKDLGLPVDWHKACNDKRTAFHYIRNLLEECGVLVMMNGICGKNTHRPLQVNEFRAFAMADKYAPLIFINGADSQGAKLFSIIHEAVHIWIGEDDFYNDRYWKGKGIRPEEVLCNRVTAELFVPEQAFHDRWIIEMEEEGKDSIQIIHKLAKHFRCGESVIARKALDSGKIQKVTYDVVIGNAIDKYNKSRSDKEETGGNYYNTMGSRLDKNFVRALWESIQMGRTSYGEAYHLTNTNRKTFSRIVQNLGGADW